MTPTYTLATVSKNLDGTYTIGNKPVGAYSFATGPAGAEDPTPFTNFGGAGTSTSLSTGISLTTAQALMTNNFPSPKVVAGLQYAIEDSAWNNGSGGTVTVEGLNADEYTPTGWAAINGVSTFVSVDVANATYAPYAGGGASQTNVAAVPSAKRIQVAADIDSAVGAGGQAMIQETDPTLAGKYFKDNRSPAAPYFYWCVQEANPLTGATETWWNRFRIQ